MLRILLSVGTLFGVMGITSKILQFVMLCFSIYLYVVLMFSFRKFKPKSVDDYKPLVSILIPAHNEQDVIADTLKCILAQDYKPLEVIVIDDASSDLTPIVLENFKHQYERLTILRRELYHERGKPAALNDALKLAHGDIIAVFDADTRIKPDFVSRIVPYLRDRRVGGVQAKVRMYNRNQNIITAVQDSEFAIHCSVMQAGRDKIRGCTGLGGNGQFVKRYALESCNGWKTGTLAEDFDLTLSMMEKGYRIRYANVSVYQEAVPKLRALFRQRMRWSQGNLQSTFDHMWKVIRNKQIRLRTKFDALYIFSSFTQPFILLSSFTVTGIDLMRHEHFHFHPGHVDPYMLTLLLSYVLFVAIGHIMGKPEDWKLLPLHIVAYYMYSFLWSFVFIYGMCLYVVKRGNIQWAKTHHSGTNNNGIGAYEESIEICHLMT